MIQEPMTQDTTADSLVGILDELTDLISSARAMPMSASALINRAEVLDLLTSAREVLPSQLARADKLLADADAVLAEAEDTARGILERAAAEAERTLSTDAIIAEARARADRLARDADDYCDQTLAELEIDLGRITSQVTAGRTRLAERNSQEGLT